MHSILVRNYRYKYSREGIVPGTWYNDFLLDPKSVSLGHSEIARCVDYDIVTVSGRVLLTRDQDGEVRDCGSTVGPQVFSLSEAREITDRDRAGYAERLMALASPKTLTIPCYRALVVDGTEYGNRYAREHINELRVLLDRIRTDALLEELDA